MADDKKSFKKSRQAKYLKKIKADSSKNYLENERERKRQYKKK